ncbi:hypothetical protein [Brachybacterium sp. FME24]|uniref:hypothetical protein n=1 Tax=Brachybacterium sp. FME24 TaxID=2742605 RepID=UPI00186896F8|nr:hypothetical protein [Brachybacterium sp. FME24]
MTDPRSPSGPRSRGFEAVLIIVYALFALSATARSLVQMGRDFSFAPVAYVLSLLAALTYIAVAVALVRRGRRSPLAVVLCLIELVGVLAVGTLSVLEPALLADDTVWSGYGQGYGYVPLLLPIVALVYIVLGRRARRAEPAEPAAAR